MQTEPRTPSRITDLLRDWNNGDESALAELVPIVHGELRRLARRQMHRERPDHTLQTSALINEAYLRLPGVRRMQWRDRAHFFAMAARLMRRVLIDHARGRRYLKRGGVARKVPLDDAGQISLPPSAGEAPWSRKPGRDLEALDVALAELEAVDARKSAVIELRFFGGLTIEETADVLKLSPDTVMRDWRLAKAWLLRRLKERPTS
jgi:RNA polymerase sigma-70 factor, ECF subfamily